MAVPIDFLSSRDRARLARSQGVTLDNGDVYRRGVLVSSGDAARSATTIRTNEFLDASTNSQRIRTNSEIQANPSLATPISIFDNRAVGQLAKIAAAPTQVAGAITTPSLANGAAVTAAQPTTDQVYQAAAALRAVNGLLPGRNYTDAALAKATPAQIVSEAATINNRLQLEQLRKQQTAASALGAGTAAIAGGAPTLSSFGQTTPTFTSASPINSPEGLLPTPATPIAGGPSGTIEVNGLPYTQPAQTPLVADQNAATEAAGSLALIGGSNVAAATTPTFSFTGASNQAAGTNTARQRALNVIANSSNMTPDQASDLLRQADQIDDPTGEKAFARRASLESAQILERRGIDQKYFETPSGKQEIAQRQAQLDSLTAQASTAQNQLDDKLKAADAQFAGYIRSKVASAEAGLTNSSQDQKLKAQLANMAPQVKYDVLQSNGYIVEGDNDKATVKAIAATREAAQREYQNGTNQLGQLRSQITQAYPQLLPFGSAPADVTAAPNAPVSAFGATAATAAAPTQVTANGDTISAAFGGAAPAAVAPAQAATQTRSIGAQLSDIFFQLGQPNADVRSLVAQRNALEAQKRAIEGLAAQTAADTAAAASARAEAQRRLNALAAGTAGASASVFQ